MIACETKSETRVKWYNVPMSLKNSKAKGSRNEKKTIQYFEERSYWCIKAGGSLGVWDVVCVGTQPEQGGVLIQCKSNRWPSRDEMKTLAEFACDPVFSKLVHRWDDRAREPKVRDLAKWQGGEK